jgi:hypothetical protein
VRGSLKKRSRLLRARLIEEKKPLTACAGHS